MDAIRLQGEAADRLTKACTSNVAAEQRLDDRPPIERILHKLYGVAAVTPTEMLHQLGKMK